MDNEITIIEGPPPVFENVIEGWALGLNEGPILYDLALTKLRTFNGAALVERCYRTWNSKNTMYLHYKNTIGLVETTPIVAARSLEVQDGQMLLLWVRRNIAEIEEESGEDSEDGFNKI